MANNPLDLVILTKWRIVFSQSHVVVTGDMGSGLSAPLGPWTFHERRILSQSVSLRSASVLI